VAQFGREWLEGRLGYQWRRLAGSAVARARCVDRTVAAGRAEHGRQARAGRWRRVVGAQPGEGLVAGAGAAVIRVGRRVRGEAGAEVGALLLGLTKIIDPTQILAGLGGGAATAPSLTSARLV
jgi:hypothetical protein